MSSASSTKAVSFHLPAAKFNGLNSHPALLSSKTEKRAMPPPAPEAVHPHSQRSPTVAVNSATIGSHGTAKQSSPLPSQMTIVKPLRNTPSERIFVRSSVKAPAVAAAMVTTAATESSKVVKGTTEESRIAHELRQSTNTTSHDHIRRIKYQVARLREQLLRVEEEVRHSNRGRHTMELAIQDIRKALSVSQQSLSAQQKKMRGTEVYTWISILPP